VRMKTTWPIFPPHPRSTFTSERLLLRSMKPSDAEDLHAIRTDAELMKWTSQLVPDVDIEATRTWMSKFMPPNDMETFGFSIEELSNPGRVVGSIGVHKSNPPDFGYLIAHEHWGKGFATEAARAFLPVYWALERKIVDVKDGDQEHERLPAGTDVGNKPSQNVLQKCGFVYAGESEYKGRVTVQYYLEAPALN
jgi:[ribosomal protein S5]-alanine N-acetyltransferase